MKKWYYSLPAKTASVFLSIILICVTVIMVASFVGVTILAGYFGNAETAKQNLAKAYLNSNAYQAFYYYVDNDGKNFDDYVKDENYYITIKDENDEVLYSNYDGQTYLAKQDEEMEYGYHIEPENVHTDDVIYVERYYYITAYAKIEPTTIDLYAYALEYIDFAFSNRVLFLIISIINIIFIISLLVYFCHAVGRRYDKEGIHLGFADKIPFDIFLAIYALIITFEVIIISDASYSSTVAMIIAIAFSVFLDVVLLLLLIATTAIRAKSGTVIKNTVIYYIIRYTSRFFKFIFAKLKYLFSSLPLIPKTLAAIALILIYNIILFSSCYYVHDMVIFVFLEFLIIIPVVIYYVISLRHIQKAGERIAGGDLEHSVELKFLSGNLLSFAKCLNNIGGGMKQAVANQIKSERLKTELITNVSHDIKTPLTSIINYVDLIKKEDTDNEKVCEYISVLDKQSGRLKKLIEDLIEASKASTGNIAVNFEPCELGVLLAQTAGEYEERAKKNDLTILIDKDDTPINILADGRHLWRIFDNLMNNICKYSQPGTRVYLSLKKINNKAVVTFRNISKASLNISGDELTDRFVRGDSSRNTEGSGLGLSIAKSLAELQNGKMVINIDGDLFKVLLTFDII